MLAVKKTKNLERQCRYRQRHRRIDYVPDRDVLAIVVQRANLTRKSLAATLDALVREAVKPKFRHPRSPVPEPQFWE